MITTKTQFKPKHTYLYAYLYIYLYLVYPVYLVKNNFSSSSVPSVAKNRILQNKPNSKAGSWPLAAFFPNEPNLISQFFILNSPFRSLRLRNEPKLSASYLSVSSVAKNRILQNKPNSTFLNPCIPASVYSCSPPNEPNFIPSYPSVAKNRILQNKANLQEAGSRQLEAFPPNEPNSTFLYPGILVSLHSWILHNKPNSTFLNPCIPASMYSCCSPNEANFKKYTENVNICGSKNCPPAYLLIVTSG